MSDETPIDQAVEQLPIPLFDGVVLAARTNDGQIHLSLRDLCTTIGLDTTSQRRRIRANESLHLTAIRVHIDRQFRTLDFLLLDDLALWILTLQMARIHPESQSRVSYIKQYLETSVRHAFAQLTGLPETSRQVEELRELDRLDRALELLEQLNARQSTIEISQDRARIAFRDLWRNWFAACSRACRPWNPRPGCASRRRSAGRSISWCRPGAARGLSARKISAAVRPFARAGDSSISALASAPTPTCQLPSTMMRSGSSKSSTDR